jgi:AhpD family alkylhydroperoxidase
MGGFKMSRQEIYKEIEETFGLVPTFFKLVPDSSLELEWRLFKRTQLEEGAVPQKYRELIGIAISGVMKCRFCALYHTEAAKLSGATEAEIEDAVHFAKSSAGWSTYINGLQIDFDQFKEEIRKASEYIRSKTGMELEVKCRDVGVDCDYVARGRTEDELLKNAAEHGKSAHEMEHIPPEIVEKVRSAIHYVAKA